MPRSLWLENRESNIQVTTEGGQILTFIWNPNTGMDRIKSWLFEHIRKFRIEDFSTTDTMYQTQSEFAATLTDNNVLDGLGTTITVVRDPYTRIREQYEQWHRGNATSTDPDRKRFANHSFNRFIETEIPWRHGRFLEQKRFVEPADIVLKYEDLEEEFMSKVVVPYFDTSFGGLRTLPKVDLRGALDDKSFLLECSDMTISYINQYDEYVFNGDCGYNTHVG